MRKFWNIVIVWNFSSVLMILSRISIKVFTNILLGLIENFETILGSFRVYFAKIIFRAPEENFEKVCKRKNFRVISKNFWLNLGSNEEIFGEIERFFSEIVKRLGKFIQFPGKFRKILILLQRTLRNILKKREVNFEEIFWIKNVLSLSPYATPLLPQNRALLLRLPIASYLSLIYITATAQAICEEIIFVDASSGRLPVYTEMVVSSNCDLHIITMKFFRKGFFCRHLQRSEGPLQKNFYQIKVEEDLKFLYHKLRSNIP